MSDVHALRLEYLRGEIRAGQLSYGELAELQDLAAHIDPGDVELLEWAGVPEESSRPSDEERVADLLRPHIPMLAWDQQPGSDAHWSCTCGSASAVVPMSGALLRSVLDHAVGHIVERQAILKVLHDHGVEVVDPEAVITKEDQ